MNTLVQIDMNKVKTMAKTVKTGEELIEELQQELNKKSLMKSITLDLDRIRDFVITAKSIDEIINLLTIEVELLEEMKSDGVILLEARYHMEIIYCYLCTINHEISKKYGFIEGIWGDDDEEYVDFIVADIREKLDNTFNDEDMFYTYEFVMKLPEDVGSMDGLMAYIQGKIDLLTSMKNEGIYLEDISQSGHEDGHYIICLNTTKPEVAKKYGFYKVSNFPDEGTYSYEINHDEILV